MGNGIRWQVGNITDLSKAISEYTESEIAYLIGFGMVQNSQDGVFKGSVGSMARAMWAEASDEVIKRATHNVARILRKNGFEPVQLPTGFAWRVPSSLNEWQEPENARRETALHTGAPSENGEVREGYTCTVPDCGSNGVVMTKEDRDTHYRKHHRGKSQVPVPAKSEWHPTQDLLYEAIKRASGAKAREYALRIGKSPGTTTHAAQALIEKGLIYRTGKTAAVRYHLAGTTSEYANGDKPKKPNGKSEKTRPLEKEKTPVVAFSEDSDRVLVDEKTGEKLVFKNGRLFRVKTVLEEIE